MTRPRSRARLAAAALVVLTAATLTACQPEDDEVGGASGAAPTTPTTAEATPAPEPTEEAPASDPPALSAQECLVGTWLADNDFFLSFIREFGDEVKSITGEVFVTYGTDGTHETEYSDWEITAESEGITVVIRREGTDTGEYSATPSALTFGDTTMGSTITLSGEGFDMSVEPEPSTHSSLPYTCDATTLILTTPETDVTMTRR